jgi:hypothetical protein
MQISERISERISDYTQHWSAVVERYAQLPFVIECTLSTDVRPKEQAFIKCVIVFTDGARLYFREFIDASGGLIVKVSYSYHALDEDKALIFRYDNALHRPPLGFDEHKHLSDGRIVPAPAPPVEYVCTELVLLRSYI